MKRFLRSLWARIRPRRRITVPGAYPLDDTAGESHSAFVSRHSIAEGGLTCPVCKNVAAEYGDFSSICVDQRGNEVVLCGHCSTYLIASPDTEHGDHLLPYDPVRFHSFVRKPQKQVTKEKYGEDALPSQGGGAIKVNRVRLGKEAAVRLSKEEARQEDPSRRDTVIPDKEQP